MAKVNTAKISRGPDAPEQEKPQFARKRALVLPTLSIKGLGIGESIFVRFDTAPFTKVQLAKDGTPKLDPDTQQPLSITTAQVTNIENGALGEIVLPFMVMKGLAQVGTPETLVGKRFEFVKGAKVNRTTLWEVWELGDE
jgi:hypothetical protein